MTFALHMRKVRVMIDALNAFIGERLTQARIARGLTLADVAAALETSAATIEAYEKGTVRISSGRLIRACDMFGVEPDYFFQRP